MMKRLSLLLFLMVYGLLGGSSLVVAQTPTPAPDERLYNCAIDVDDQSWIKQRPDKIANEEEKKAYNSQCSAPRLRHIQETAVNVIYILWIGGIPVFGIAFGYVGFRYMTSNADPNAFGDLVKRSSYIGLGLVVFVGTYPVANGAMGFIINNNVACYAGLDTPGFRIFFPNVCTDEEVFTVNSCSDLPDGRDACLTACGIYGRSTDALVCNPGDPVCELRLNNYALEQDDTFFIQKQLICDCPNPDLGGGAAVVNCRDVSPANGATSYP